MLFNSLPINSWKSLLSLNLAAKCLCQARSTSHDLLIISLRINNGYFSVFECFSSKIHLETEMQTAVINRAD